jgi:hypothetical protein
VVGYTHRMVLAGGTFLPRQYVSMDISNHRLSVRNRHLSIRKRNLGIRNPHVSVDRQPGLKGDSVRRSSTGPLNAR